MLWLTAWNGRVPRIVVRGGRAAALARDGGVWVAEIRYRLSRGRGALLVAVAGAAAAIGCAGGAASSRPPALAQGSKAAVVQQALPAATPQILPPPAELSTVTFYTQSGALPQLHVDIADTLQKQETGLMNVNPLPTDEGEIFIFDGLTTTPFYMKDTEINLSIAWLDENGIIVDIQDMQAETLDLHYPAKQYRYAIEANQGWYAQNGVNVGDYADLRAAYAASPVFGTPDMSPTPAQ